MTIENIDYVLCKICNQQKQFISTNHVKTHNITIEQYKLQFPNAPLYSKKFIEHRSAIAVKHNESRKGKQRSEETKQKIKETKALNPHKGYKLPPRSVDHNNKISKAKKAAFENGTTVHWNLGRTTSDEVKQKISKTIKQKNSTKEATPSLAEQQIKTILQTLPSFAHKLYTTPSSGTLSRLSTLQNHFILTHDVFDCKIIDVDPKGALLHYTLICNHCTRCFSITNQYFRPCKLEVQQKRKLCPFCYPRDITRSQYEIELHEFVSSIYNNRIIPNDRIQLDGLELDLWLPDDNIAIEFSGLYWHSEEVHTIKYNLYEKYLKCKQKNIYLITILEDEWINKKELCKQRITYKLKRTNNPITYARKTTIKQIDSLTKTTFLNQYHIQGTDICKLSYGAFLNDELIAVMTFKPTSFIKGGTGKEYELSRFAVKSNIHAPGIASKLFTTFIRNNLDVSTIISYSDNRWNTGEVYKQLGMLFERCTQPSYWYFKSNEMRRYHRSAFMRHTLLDDPTDIRTEYEIMKERGYFRIWDCGNTKWVWTRKKHG